MIIGYVRHKRITFQNLPSQVQVKNFFILYKHVPFSRYYSFCVFNHLMINQICDVMMSHTDMIMRQGAFLNKGFEPRLIKSPNLAK